MKYICLVAVWLVMGISVSGQTLLTDFEGAPISIFTFGGAAGNVVGNPVVNVDNPSANVGRIERFGPAVFAGGYIDFPTNLNFAAEPFICFKVYTGAAIATQVTVKMEGSLCAPGCNSGEIDAVTTVTNGWETICFDFTGTPASYDRLVFLFDLGEVGNGGVDDTFFFDDITQYAAIPSVGISLPINFEGDVVTSDFANFDGGVGSVVANPSVTGINTSPLVGRIVRSSQNFSGSRIVLDQNLDFSTETIISMKVYTTEPIGTPIIFKLEGNPTTAEDNVVTTVSGEWETFEFDFSGTASTLNELVFLFDANNSSTGSIFYFDDIVQTTPTPVEIALPITFELDEPDVITTANFANFDGGIGSVVANPSQTGINTSPLVGRIVRSSQNFSGSRIVLDQNLDFSTETIISMKVYTDEPVGTPIIFKLEGGPPAEDNVVTTVTGEWETFQFDFTGTPTTLNELVFLFDANNSSPGSIFYFDDIIQINTSVLPNPNITLPIAFEGDVVTTDFVDFDGAEASVLANIFQTGINNSSTVARIIRNGAANNARSKLALENNLDFTSLTTLSMKVYTTAPAGTPIRLRLEGGSSEEKMVFTTVSGEWETLEWDFDDVAVAASTNNVLVFMFDDGSPGFGLPNSIFYFDDIEQLLPNEVALAPIDFEGGIVVESNFRGIGEGFGGGNGVDFGVATVVPNPDMSGINMSNTVAQIVRHPGSTSAGAFVHLTENLNFDAYPIICMNVFTDAPVGTRVVLRIEDTDTGMPDIDEEAFTVESGVWEPLCFVYQLVPDGYDRLTFLFDFGNEGTGASASTFLFDDIGQLITPTNFFFVPGSEYFCPGFPVTFDFPGSFNWYSDASGNVQIGTGNPFTTPVLNFNTSFYVRNLAPTPGIPVDVGPSIKDQALQTVGPAFVEFTSNIDGFWHGVDIIRKWVGNTGPNNECTYTVTGRNLTPPQTSSSTEVTISTLTLDNSPFEYVFSPPIPMEIGDAMELEVTVSGNGCFIRSFLGYDNLGPQPYPRNVGQITFTGYNAPGFANDSRWMGFDYQISLNGPPNNDLIQVNAIADCANPLPIELIDFSVRESDGDALLLWSTASEVNNEKFHLLRSRDGVEFETIGTVNGAGNSTSVLYYSFRDRQPLEGVSYYQLKQVDYDGTESLSPIVSFVNGASAGFTLFPNPTSERLTLSLDKAYDQIEVLVYGITGSLVNRFSFSAMETLNFELEGNPGMYFVEVLANEERKATFHVMKH